MQFPSGSKRRFLIALNSYFLTFPSPREYEISYKTEYQECTIDDTGKKHVSKGEFKVNVGKERVALDDLAPVLDYWAKDKSGHARETVEVLSFVQEEFAIPLLADIARESPNAAVGAINAVARFYPKAGTSEALERIGEELPRTKAWGAGEARISAEFVFGGDIANAIYYAMSRAKATPSSEFIKAQLKSENEDRGWFTAQ